ncbi:MAG: LicD family protein [Cocleimonas sp.]
MKTINTNNGIYEYHEIELTGEKRINRLISKDNLLDLKILLDENNIKFGLIYGTLLGAYRENNFIEHDIDTDIFILNEDQDKLISILFELRNIGFEVARYRGSLVSIIRNDEYIDIYIFQKKGRSTRECLGNVINSCFLDNLKEYEFLGKMFNIPEDTEKLLVSMYGKDWMTPKENTPATNYGWYLTIRSYISRSQTLFKIIGWIKRKVI